MFFMHWDRTQLFIGCVPWQGALLLNFHGSTLRSRLLAPETDILTGFSLLLFSGLADGGLEETLEAEDSVRPS